LLKKLSIMLIIIIILYLILFQVFDIQNVILKIMYPKKYSEHVELYSEEYNVDELLIYSIIKAESNFDKNATSKSGAKGLMQVMSSTAYEVEQKIEEQNTTLDLYNEQKNIKIGTYYFSQLYEKYNNIGLALAAYNAGMGRVNKWLDEGIIKQDGSDLENIPFKETNIYVRKILNYYDNYKKIYE